MTKAKYQRANDVDDEDDEMIDIHAMEEETLVEMREWGRRRMEEKLRAKAAGFSPERQKTPAGRAKTESDTQDEGR